MTAISSTQVLLDAGWGTRTLGDGAEGHGIPDVIVINNGEGIPVVFNKEQRKLMSTKSAHGAIVRNEGDVEHTSWR